MPAPGYGGNDLALIVKVAWKLKEIYQRSPGQFQSLSRQGLDLENAVKQAYKSASKDQLSAEQQVRLQLLVGTTKELLQKLYDVLVKYESLRTNHYRTWDRLFFGALEEVTLLQNEMTAHADSLHRFRTDVIGNKVTEIKDILDGLVKDKARTGSITTTPSDVVAGEITDGLEHRGVPQEFIAENGQLIVEWIVDLFRTQGFEVDTESGIDPLSPITLNERLSDGLDELKGDDQAIVNNWLDTPDPPRSYAGVFVSNGRSRSPDWVVPQLIQTNSSQESSSQPERKRSSLRSLIREIGSSSTAHEDDGSYDSSRRNRESTSFSSPSDDNARNSSYQRQGSGSSLGPGYITDSPASPRSLKSSITSTPEAISPKSRANSDIERLPSSSPPASVASSAILNRCNTSPSSSKLAPNNTNAIPRSTPSRNDSIRAVGLGIGIGSDQNERSAMSSGRRKNSSSSTTRSTPSSPKLTFLSKLGSSHTATGT